MLSSNTLPGMLNKKDNHDKFIIMRVNHGPVTAMWPDLNASSGLCMHNYATISCNRCGCGCNHYYFVAFVVNNVNLHIPSFNINKLSQSNHT